MTNDEARMMKNCPNDQSSNRLPPAVWPGPLVPVLGHPSLFSSLLTLSKEMQHPFSSGRNGRSLAVQANVPSPAKRIAFFT